MIQENAKVGMKVRVHGRIGIITEMGFDGARVQFPNGYEAGYYWFYIHKVKK